MGVGGQSSQEPDAQQQPRHSAKRTKFSEEPWGRLPRGRWRKAHASTLCPLERSNPRGRLPAKEPGPCGPGQGGGGLGWTAARIHLQSQNTCTDQEGVRMKERDLGSGEEGGQVRRSEEQRCWRMRRGRSRTKRT